MPTPLDPAIEIGRLPPCDDPALGTLPCDPSGVFRLVHPRTGGMLEIHATSGEEWHTLNLPGPAWQRLTVRGPGRLPTFEELDWIVKLFSQPTERWALAFPRYPAPPDTVHLMRPAVGNLPEPPLESIA
jgi:hypothetical protein